jgi:hypothetical protein
LNDDTVGAVRLHQGRADSGSTKRDLLNASRTLKKSMPVFVARK